MEITLQPITKENWFASTKLHVRPDQASYVAANVYSIAQAQWYPEWEPLAIYDGETMVGFVMHGVDEEIPARQWIIRMMIDQAHQGRGYGRAAMVKVIERLTARPGCEEIRLSFVPGNEGALALYRSLGFVETGEEEDGELIMALPVNQASAGE